MLIFFSEGRLGNQLFQYAFLKSRVKKNERILVFGFSEIKQFLEKVEVINVPMVRFATKVFFFIQFIFKFLSNFKIINKISLSTLSSKFPYEGGLEQLIKKKGFIKSITFIKTGYFQSEIFFQKKIVDQFCIKKIYLEKANSFLKSIPSNFEKIFVHIRMGDFQEFKLEGKNVVLPISYYKKQIEWFSKNKKNSFFIFLSDDIKFVEENFENIKNKIISKNSQYVDMSIMTKCHSAVLSASSFSWWGAYLMKEKKDIFCPKYFMGFNINRTFPHGIVTDFFKEIEIY